MSIAIPACFAYGEACFTIDGKTHPVRSLSYEWARGQSWGAARRYPGEGNRASRRADASKRRRRY